MFLSYAVIVGLVRDLCLNSRAPVTLAREVPSSTYEWRR